ncbi:citrate/2-methylcitrate synthase [Tautonia plasticadhaerens]|uniref:Citrate synthase n=1 Tax=Tautonia plasticadhaerens TaxID=2527974 RepID=A0A518H5H6_9BACT|nr:citrate/2-methylcitrate synthase [Tautonia plasticadhaerens]QDV36085.1 Citrate synthase 2 [Tautonia plasticadhaerens]
MSSASEDTYFPGLEGVISNETAIADMQGTEGQGGLAFRGYAIEDLAGKVSYEEAAFLLLHGDLPSKAQLEEFGGRLSSARAIPDPLVTLLKAVPEGVHPMDTLRTAVSVLAHYDPEVNAPVQDHAANVRKAERLIAQMATAVAAAARVARGQEPIAPKAGLGHAANFLAMLNGADPTEAQAEAFDLSLTLYAEHELNASTFAARVTASTLSDIHSAIVSAVGTLKGSLHGGANEKSWEVLQQVGEPEKAERWIQDALARKERIMGFGHRVYKTGDPRAVILKRHCQRVAAEIGDDRWERIAEPIERAVTGQKNLPPNVDWPSARLYHYLGIEVPIYTPIFAMARVAGWAAHVIEQLDNNRLMRPRARYVGTPNRAVRPIADRG